jgi:hypothetical protein
VPDQRPGCGPGAADELVEQLDRKQDEDGAAGAAREPAELRAGAGHDAVILSVPYAQGFLLGPPGGLAADALTG